jgi:tetratricopeptide (TPR) repeat protein
MIMNKKLSLVTRHLVFAGALLVGCDSPNAAKQRLVREQKNPAQMPSWEATKQSELAEPTISDETYMAAGRLHERMGRLTRASAQYRMAVQLKPDNVEAHNRLGVVLCQMRQFKEADAELAKAIKLAPDQAHLYNNLGFSYLAQTRWADAEQQFSKAIQSKPTFVRAHINLAMALAQQEKYDEAMQHFQTVVPLEDAWFNIGLMYQSKSRRAEAARAFKTALKLNPALVAAQQCLDKLPPDVVGRAEPFANTAALAIGPARSEPTPPSGEPSKAVASTSRPSDSGQTSSVRPLKEEARTAKADESSDFGTGQSISEFPQAAEANAESEPLNKPEPSIAETIEKQTTGEATGQMPTRSQSLQEEPGDAERLDPERLAVLLRAQAAGGPVLPPDNLGFNLATQPENEPATLSIDTEALGLRSEETPSATESSTSQPSSTPGELGIRTYTKDLPTLRKSPIDLSSGSLAAEEEIVLGAKPPMPPQARRVGAQATQPSAGAPTPEELRLVIEALLELNQAASSPQMPKPFALPASRPAEAAPGSRPSAGATTKPSQVSMNVGAGKEPAAQEHRPLYDDLDEAFAPGETFGPDDAEE